MTRPVAGAKSWDEPPESKDPQNRKTPAMRNEPALHLKES
jgi:hypothetical protein